MVSARTRHHSGCLGPSASAPCSGAPGSGRRGAAAGLWGAGRGAEAAEADDSSQEREIDAVMAAGDEARDGRVRAAPAPSARDVQDLFSGLKVQRTAQGGLVIEAPPETASTLAALVAGMAQLLQAAAAAAAPAPPGTP